MGLGCVMLIVDLLSPEKYRDHYNATRENKRGKCT